MMHTLDKKSGIVIITRSFAKQQLWLAFWCIECVFEQRNHAKSSSFSSHNYSASTKWIFFWKRKTYRIPTKILLQQYENLQKWNYFEIMNVSSYPNICRNVTPGPSLLCLNSLYRHIQYLNGKDTDGGSHVYMGSLSYVI